MVGRVRVGQRSRFASAVPRCDLVVCRVTADTETAQRRLLDREPGLGRSFLTRVSDDLGETSRTWIYPASSLRTLGGRSTRNAVHRILYQANMSGWSLRSPKARDGMDRRRAYRKARRHRVYRVIVVCLVAMFLVAAGVHVESHWSVPGPWAAVLLVGVVVTATGLVFGVQFGYRKLHR